MIDSKKHNIKVGIPNNKRRLVATSYFRRGMLILILLTSSISAYVFSSLSQALNLQFSSATVIKRKQVYLSISQLKNARKLAGSDIKIKSRMLTRYTAYKGKKKIGYAYIDNHPVRTLNESVLFLLNSDGSIKSVQVLEFHEPLEYIASHSWLKQFIKQKLTKDLSLRGDIQGLTGATLSSHAITDASRRVLALHKVCLP